MELKGLADDFSQALIHESDPIVCKGLVFRCRKSIYIQPSDGAYVESVKMVPLRRESCTGCEKCEWLHEFMSEDIDFHEAETLIEETSTENGKKYRYEVVSTSTDWETGICDDVYCGFVLIEDDDNG